MKKQKKDIEAELPLDLNKTRPLRFVFMLLVIIAYIPFFPSIYQKIGDSALALTMIIPVFAGWLLGLRGGLLLSVFNALVTVSLGFSVNKPVQEAFHTGIPAGIVMVILGMGIGRLRDLHIQVKVELFQRTKAEDELKKIHSELEVRVKERTLELQEANDRLRVEIMERKHAEEETRRVEAQLLRAKKMETLGTLAGGVAHDLNNILGGLSSYPELLLMDLPENSSLKKPLLTIQKSGEKASAIVQDLLTLARRGVSVTEVVNLNHIVSEYFQSIEHEGLKSIYPAIRFETNFGTDLLNILGSPVHLGKTVMNLVSNATESIPDKGTVYVTTGNRYVDRPLKGYEDVKEGEYVILEVADTGIGVPPQDMDKIFEPFYTKKIMGRSGTGLGMAVVWGTVKDHEGYIEVRSKEGKGTEFSLYFPVTRKEPAKDTSDISFDDYQGNGETILIVDDIEDQRIIATKIMTKLGYNTTSVSSGEKAIEYMRNNSVDLIVLDMIMEPGFDGLDTYKRIIELHPEQKAIIVSGFTETDRIREAKKMGVGSYLKKPYLLKNIGIAVKKELDNEKGGLP